MEEDEVALLDGAVGLLPALHGLDADLGVGLGAVALDPHATAEETRQVDLVDGVVAVGDVVVRGVHVGAGVLAQDEGGVGELVAPLDGLVEDAAEAGVRAAARDAFLEAVRKVDDVEVIVDELVKQIDVLGHSSSSLFSPVCRLYDVQTLEQGLGPDLLRLV